MFVCDSCLTRFTTEPSIGRSHGKCEICGNVHVCNDIHHSRLIFKRAWAEVNMSPEWFASASAVGAIEGIPRSRA